jgi:hypothetical protein
MNDCLTKSKLDSILNLIFDLHKRLQTTTPTNSTSDMNYDDNRTMIENSAILSSLLNVIPSLTTTTTSTSSSQTNQPEPILEYTIDVVTPLIVGLFVAMILGWMLIRYKMSAHTRSNYNGSIYCCPDECFDFCAKVCKCNFKFNLTKFLAKHQRGNNNNNNNSSNSSNKKRNNSNPPSIMAAVSVSQVKETPQIIIRYENSKLFLAIRTIGPSHLETFETVFFKNPII